MVQLRLVSISSVGDADAWCFLALDIGLDPGEWGMAKGPMSNDNIISDFAYFDQTDKK